MCVYNIYLTGNSYWSSCSSAFNNQYSSLSTVQ